MSMTLATPRARLENINRSSEVEGAAASEDDLEVGKPSLASWRKFAAKFPFRFRHLDVNHHESPRRLSAHIDTKNGFIRDETQQASSARPTTSEGVLRSLKRDTQAVQSPPSVTENAQDRGTDNSAPILQAPRQNQSSISGTPDEADEETTSRTSDGMVPVSVKPSEAAKPREVEDAPTRDPEARTTQSDTPPKLEASGSDVHEELPENGQRRSDVSNIPSPPLSASQTVSTATTVPSINTPSHSVKGKEPIRKKPFKSLNVYVPRSKRERLLQVRIATPEIIKAELVTIKHSVADRERLSNLSGVLSSKKHRLELFGREMPLSRFSLVQVTEGASRPSNYICIHGLSTRTDITKFHTVMLQPRYQPLYQPLKLCYDTARLSKVGSTEIHDLDMSKRVSTKVLSPIKEPDEDMPLEMGTTSFLQPFHFYQPAADDETYCGASFKTLVNGKPWVSSLGGVIHLNGRMFITACQHISMDPFEDSNATSFADTLLETDFIDDVEQPLVFAGSDFDDDLQELQTTEPKEHPASDDENVQNETEWKQLSLSGAIIAGPEWCLLPIGEHSMLPNFIDVSTEKVHNSDKTAEKMGRHYFEQVADPQGGHSALIATGGDSHPSGTVLAGSSFILGGGSDGMIEAWTVLLDDTQNIKRGDSGSWIVDTFDPMHYKVLGATIARSDGEAYFVSMFDQFRRMASSAGRLERMEQSALVPTFRALVNCAHLAFLHNDPKSDRFIDEALSPRVLKQCTQGWYLHGIKSVLGVETYTPESSKGLRHTGLTNPARRLIMKSLLLRYGVELLDSLLDPTDFMKRHSSELSTSQWQMFQRLESALLHSREVERKRQGRGDAVQQPHTQARNTDLPSLHAHVQNEAVVHLPDSQQPEQHAKEYTFGLSLSPLRLGVSREGLLIIIGLLVLMVGLASVSGLAAAAVIYAIEMRNSQQGKTMSMTMADYETLGAVAGPISAAAFVVQILHIYLSMRFDWSLLCGRRTLSRSPARSISLRLVIILASSFARTMFPALFVAKHRGMSDYRGVLIAASGMAAPLIVSTAFPFFCWIVVEPPSFYILRRRVYGYVPISWIVYPTWFILQIGMDSLAGYTFGKITQNTGHRYLYPSSAAAGAAVFSTLGIGLVFTPLTVLLCLISSGMKGIPRNHTASDPTPRSFSMGPYELDALHTEQKISNKQTKLSPDSQSIKSEKPTKSHLQHPAEPSSSSTWAPSTTWGGSTAQNTLSSHLEPGSARGFSTVSTLHDSYHPPPLRASVFYERSDSTIPPRPLTPPTPFNYPSSRDLGIVWPPPINPPSGGDEIGDPSATLSGDLSPYLEQEPSSHQSDEHM